ncbi:MAG TPA: DUF4382 domain-containing protein [Bacteroidales bacterium]|nr:DUF4382 domain-containing protein [Bacteroidales bacterium]
MKKTALLIFTALALVLMSACDKTSSGDTGRMVIKITDDPFDISYVEAATVTITKIELRKACDGMQDGNQFILLSDDTMTVDLINLRNGLTETLLDLEIPEGEYNLVRLYVEEAGLKLKDNADAYSVKVPGGSHTGIKIFITPAVIVSGGLTSEVLLDFDLSRSFVLRGNMMNNNGFIFKPCIRAANLTTAGRIAGMVSDTSKVKVADAKVWVMQDTIMATTFSDTTGHYALIGLDAGTYSIFATKEGYDTVGFEGVTVTAGNRTIKDFFLTKK